MIDIENVEKILRARYSDLEILEKDVYRGIDRFGERAYAINYFDLRDELNETASTLKQYQEKMLSEKYFSQTSPTDLRWNHYLYFVISEEKSNNDSFYKTKLAVEADREYARKRVILEKDLDLLLAREEIADTEESLPTDLTTSWTNVLNENGLGYVINEKVSIPEAVRRICSGVREDALPLGVSTYLISSEEDATSHFLKRIKIEGFRPHPLKKEHELGRVNLINGTNGVGKTSFLEAIEYLYCGSNRREGPVVSKTIITADMEGTDEILSSTTIPDRLRARHSKWYAKTELRTVTIQDSFGKFNFLDTDAAVNLSLTSSSQRIGSDVSKLVLGPEAEHLSDRMRRVRERLYEEKRDLQKSINAKQVNSQAAETRLRLLEKTPKLSDGIFTEFLLALDETGWKSNILSKESINDLRLPLQQVISGIQFLQALDFPFLGMGHDDISNMRNALGDATAKVQEIKELKQENGLKTNEFDRDFLKNLNQIERLQQVSLYTQSNFYELISKRGALSQVVNTRAAKLAPFSGEMKFSDQTLVLERIDVAMVKKVRAAAQLKSQLKIAVDAFDVFQATQKTIVVLRQQLLSAAHELLKSSSHPDVCPLCHTDHAKGELTIRMLADNDMAVGAQVKKFKNQVEDISNELSLNQNDTVLLQSVLKFVDGEEREIVANVLDLIEREKEYQEKDIASLSETNLLIDQLEEVGLTENDWLQKVSAADIERSISELSLNEEINNAISHSEILRSNIESLQLQMAAYDVQLEKLAMEFGISGFSGLDDLNNKLSKNMENITTANNVINTITQYMDLGLDANLKQLEIKLEFSQTLLSKLFLAISADETATASMKAELEVIDRIKENISSHRATLIRIDQASKILDELYKQSSEGDFAHQILAENVVQIAKIFSSIHTPNEFEIIASQQKLKIIRRTTGREIQLTEMSTGQRAAFALALFLAMSARLHAGPKVLLFDDPIAHVDDINVLSFLDHLRDLAIKGARQIFFTTADSKLAGLFRQKFRFLGTENFKEIVLTRQ